MANCGDPLLQDDFLDMLIVAVASTGGSGALEIFGTASGSRMRSKGSRFTLGVWGLSVCSLDVAFTVATVRNRPQPSAGVRAIPVWPCLWEVLQRWSFLGVADVSLLRFAWQAWHFVTFRRVLERVEVVLRGRRNTFATFSEDVLQFSWQAQHFGRVHRHFSWQAQHFRRVLLRVFCKSYWQGCVKW